MVSPDDGLNTAREMLAEAGATDEVVAVVVVVGAVVVVVAGVVVTDIALRTRIHRDAFDHQTTGHEHGPCRWVGQVEADGRAPARRAGRGRGGSGLRQGRQTADAQGGGYGQWADQPQACKNG